ncbi:B-cell receptor CD22-like [Discoglossus pictus]
MMCSLPLDKVADMLEWVKHIWAMTKVTLKEMQSLLGKLNFTCRIIPMGRIFSRRLSLATAGSCISALQLDPGQFGTHSFRIGAATEAARLCLGVDTVKKIGSPILLRIFGHSFIYWARGTAGVKAVGTQLGFPPEVLGWHQMVGLSSCYHGFGVQLPENVVAWQHTCALIPCKSTLSRDYKEMYAWYQFPEYDHGWKGNVIYNSSNPKSAHPLFGERVEILGELKNNCTAILRNLSEADTGNYSVRLWKDDKHWMRQKPFLYLNISDQAPHLKIDPPSPMTEDKETKLRCSVNYYCPDYKVNLTWDADVNATLRSFFQNAAINDISTEAILKFSPSWRDHNKTIKCVLTRGEEQNITESTEIVLNVEYAPRFAEVVTEPANLKLIEGNIVKLKCITNSSNPAVHRYTWYKDKKQLNKLNKEFIDFKPIKPEDSGLYRCSAGNKVGYTQSKDISLKVLYPPKKAKVMINNQRFSIEMPVKEGQQMSLRCQAPQSEPGISGYKWYKDKIIFYQSQDSEVTFDEIKWTDSGNYTCEAKNEVGIAISPPAYVIISYAPKNVKISISPSNTVTENTAVMLTCSAEANPKVYSYSWYRNNINLRNHNKYLHITTVKTSEEGEYYCIGRNEIGDGKSEGLNLYISYSVSTIIKHTASGLGVFIAIIVFIMLVLRFKIWNKVQRQRRSQSDSAFFVMKKANQEPSDNSARPTPSVGNSVEELNYSTIQFPTLAEERRVPPRPKVKFQDPAVIYSVVNKPKVNDYENVKQTNSPKNQEESQEEIHYSTIANLPAVGIVRQSDNEVEYAMLRH